MIFKRVRQNEISNGTMLGIVLIALAAVIGLGFGVFSIAKNVSNEGVVNVQDSLALVQDSSFDDYDNKIVTGTQVQAAYKNFKGNSVAFLVNTVAMDKGILVNTGHTVYSYAIGGKAYINYNALLASKPDGTATGTKIPDTGGNHDLVVETTVEGNKKIIPRATSSLTEEPPYITTEHGFAINSADGKVLFDSNIGGWSKEGNCEYIPSNAKFEARVIKDASGTKVGVAFSQLNN